ncbi:MAG: Fe-S protein assembly co-chaperone HscB [Rhodospirillales bacterium]
MNATKTAAKSEPASGAAAPTPCWSCHAPVAPGEAFCGACRAVQPPGERDHFQRLGLPEAFALDTADLDRRYFQLQRQLHPDRFVARPAKERALSQSQAASLNAAYETLKHPLERAVYLLKRMGIEIDPGDGATIKDSALLTEAMEMREALAGAVDAAAVARIAAKAEAERKQALAAVAEAFARADRDAARAAVLRLKYLTKMGDEIRARRAALRAAAGAGP